MRLAHDFVTINELSNENDSGEVESTGNDDDDDDPIDDDNKFDLKYILLSGNNIFDFLITFLFNKLNIFSNYFYI